MAGKVAATAMQTRHTLDDAAHAQHQVLTRQLGYTGLSRARQSIEL